MTLPSIQVKKITLPLQWHNYRLIAFDMDSTLINIECIDEIADAAGLKTQVAAITEAAMRGELADYKESLRRRVEMLKGVPTQALEDIYTNRLRLNPGVQNLVETSQKKGLKTLLVSGGFTFFTDRLRERLKLDYVRSNLLEIENGYLTGRLLTQSWGDICDGEEKRRMLIETCEAHGFTAQQAITVGDGANDLPMMRVAGLAVAFHAKPSVCEQAHVAILSGGFDELLTLFA
jgi:phosphoserine phosphatase